MVLILALLFCVSLWASAQGQFKTTGIKTHYPTVMNADNLISEYNRSTNHHSYNSGHNGIVEPMYINHDATGYDKEVAVPFVPRRKSVPFDAVAAFINKTRESMSPGICFKEVPTASLAQHLLVVPAGNGSTPVMNRIQMCCEGYERHPHTHLICEPVCKDGCHNGICSAPDVCVCIPGNVRNYDDRCIPICPIGCGNGACTEDGTCECEEGFVLEPTLGQYCQPHCQQSCLNGRCVAPNQCECSQGYEVNADGDCQPHCNNCQHGLCTAPGVCSCTQGYTKSDIDGRCQPMCSLSCEGGECVAPDVCECPTGFVLNPGASSCLPHCDRPCLNGICEGNNRCVCNHGYIVDEYQPNICMPHCPHGCPDGYCSAPNFCICKAGYVKSGVKGRQTCIPRLDVRL